MKFTRLAILIFCLFFPFIGFAQKSSEVEKNTDIDRILNLVPIKQTLSELPKDLKNQFLQNPFRISDSKNDKLIKLFSEAYHVDSLLKISRERFKENFNPDYTDSVLNSLTSDKIKPALNSEAEFYTIQGIRKKIVTKYELEQNPPSEERTSIIKDLIEQSSAKESAIASQKIIFRSLVLGTDAISSKLNLNKTQINSIINNFNSRLQMQLEDELVNNYLVMYHKIPNDLIKHYTNFYATKAGSEHKESLHEAIHTAFQEASNQLISEIESL